MNHPIKFRVYDKKHKILVKYGEGIGYVGFILYMDGTIRREIINSSFDGIDRNTTEEQNNYTIQQFTGFLDADGKEIYEGDILRFKYSEEDAAEGLDAEITCVFFENGCFKYGEGNCEILEDLMNDKTMMLEDEIIGNIFENPELINK